MKAREKTEKMIDLLFDLLRDKLPVKPRTYRKTAHAIYLSQAKKKKKNKRELRKALRNGLNCIKTKFRSHKYDVRSIWKKKHSYWIKNIKSNYGSSRHYGLSNGRCLSHIPIDVIIA